MAQSLGQHWSRTTSDALRSDFNKKLAGVLGREAASSPDQVRAIFQDAQAIKASLAAFDDLVGKTLFTDQFTAGRQSALFEKSGQIRDQIENLALKSKTYSPTNDRA